MFQQDYYALKDFRDQISNFDKICFKNLTTTFSDPVELPGK